MGVIDDERSTVAVDKTDVAAECGIVCSTSVLSKTVVVVGNIDVGV
jgi:hypothetical protein